MILNNKQNNKTWTVTASFKRIKYWNTLIFNKTITFSITDTCDDVITNMTNRGSVYLTSPSYPSNYAANKECTWLVTDETPGTYYVTLFDLETEYWDPLMIGHGYDVSYENRDVWVSLWYWPTTFVIEDLVMWVRFLSNHAVTFRGFLMEIERVHDKGGLFVKIWVRKLIGYDKMSYYNSKDETIRISRLQNQMSGSWLGTDATWCLWWYFHLIYVKNSRTCYLSQDSG